MTGCIVAALAGVTMTWLGIALAAVVLRCDQ